MRMVTMKSKKMLVYLCSLGKDARAPPSIDALSDSSRQPNRLLLSDRRISIMAKTQGKLRHHYKVDLFPTALVKNT